MREIKFRAWDKKSKEMVASPLVLHLDGRLECPQGGWDVGGYDDSDGYELMQFTGLTDCNEKDIYEGDICQYRDDAHIARVGVVHYSDTSCAYSIECVCGDDEGNQDIPVHEDYRIAVIGNIYENPELIDAPSRSKA